MKPAPNTGETPDDPSDTERGEFFDAAGRFTPAIAVQGKNGFFFVGTGDRQLGRGLFVKGHRAEMGTMSAAITILQRLGLKPKIAGKTFLDIGANIGTSSITALRSFGFSSAIAIEAAPDNHRLLRMNAIANGFEDRVRALNYAVSDTEGTGWLALSGHNWGDHQVVPKKARRRGSTRRTREVIEIEQVTIRSLIESGEIDPDEIGLIWMDVQGHEGHVLEAAAPLLDRAVPMITEFHPWMLKRSQGLARMHRAVSDAYSHVVDLRTVSRDIDFQLLPSGDIRKLTDLYLGGGRRRFTDVLAVSLPNGVPEGVTTKTAAQPK